MDTRLFRKEVMLMGNRFEISVVFQEEVEALVIIEEAIMEIKRIEAILSTYREDSETNLINKQAGIGPVKVSSEVFDLIERSIAISKLTQGAFDITYGSIDKSLWNFDTTMTALPDADVTRKMVRLINYKNIILDRDNLTVFLRNKGMRLGFGGIGKGYAAEKAKQKLIELGITSGIVNASGDLAVWGCQPNGDPWTVGIVHPDLSSHAFGMMELRNSSVATSGNYEKFILINGKRYSHTIDPRTGQPVTGIKSVTIFSPNAELSDALATPVTIMGIGPGIHLINQLPETECVIIDDFNRIYSSNNIKFHK